MSLETESYESKHQDKQFLDRSKLKMDQKFEFVFVFSPSSENFAENSFSAERVWKIQLDRKSTEANSIPKISFLSSEIFNIIH